MYSVLSLGSGSAADDGMEMPGRLGFRSCK